MAGPLATAASAATPGDPSATPSGDGIIDHRIRTTGCWRDPGIAPGDTVPQTIVTAGVTREYVLHLPADYRPSRRQQLVIVFHGRGKSGVTQAATTNLTQPGTITVYPTGLPGTGKTGRAAWPGAPYSTPAMDNDPLFISDLITHLQRTLCVDANRIMLGGKSNGGAFAAALGCTMSRRIAAVAVVSGALYGQHGCSPDRPVPVLNFHGTGDTVIPYDGNADRDLPAIPDWLAQWAAQDGCHRGPRTFFQRDDVTGLRWYACRGGATVVHYRIADGKHLWPGSTSEGTTHTISATALMVSFLRHHPL
jgi:polyhydroxybutyrate depolymerase